MREIILLRNDLKSLHVGDIYYDITTGYAYRYTYKTPGLKITFSSDSRTESVNYDYVKIYYNDNGTMKLAGKFGGTDIAGASVFVPTSEFYVYWRTDSSNCNFYGFSIASVTSTSGEGTGTAESLPNYTVTELSKGTYPESPNHGNYGNNINLLWKCSGTTCNPDGKETSPESFKMAYDMLVKKSLFYLIPVLFATHPGEESLEMAKNLCTADSAAREIRKNGMGALVKCMREHLE